MTQLSIDQELFPAPVEYRTVSVVIPTRDRPGLVTKAIESVLAQDVPVDVIVIDDGSVPPAVELDIVDDSRVRVIRNDRPLGPTKARNRGMEHATGEFIAFLDDDDVWLPGKLRRCLAVFDAVTDVGVVAHRTVFDRREALVEASTDITIVTDPVARFGVTQTPHLDGLFVEANLAKKVGFDESFDAAQDVDFVIELARVSSFAMVEDVLAVRGPDTVVSAIALDRRITGRHRLREKHSDVLFADAASRAFFELRLGHLYRRAGHPLSAMRAFARSLRHDPDSRAAWRALALTLLPVHLATLLSVERRAKGPR